MKRRFKSYMVILFAVLVFAACSKVDKVTVEDVGTSAESTTEVTTPTSSDTNDDSNQVTEDFVTIKFYGSDGEYNQNIVKGFEAEHPDIKVEIVPIDFGNAEQVIKTGISSGNPVDVSFFWGTQIKSFVENDMALDLTEYLMADNKSWYDSFVKNYIDAGAVDEKYYAVSYQPVLETMYYNKAIFDEYKLEIPTTVDEYLECAKILKEHDIYMMGCWNEQHHQLLAFAYQIMAKEGVLQDAVTGKLSLSGDGSEGLRRNLEFIKNCFDLGYWYPGEGALVAMKDQVQAAWYQGKIATLFDASSNVVTYEETAEFEVGVMRQPLIDGQDGVYTQNVVTNALFVPINAKYPEQAIEFIKYYTSLAGETEIMKSGRLPSIKALQDSVEDPGMLAILATGGDDAVPYTHLQNLSAEMSNYITANLVSSVCLGEDIDTVLQDLEDLKNSTMK